MRIIYIILVFFSLKTTLFSQISATDNSDIQIFPSSNSQHEVHISINKTNPFNILVSANVSGGGSQGHYFTLDGGITWNGADALPNSGTGAGDPSTSFDASGRAYIATLRDNALSGLKVQSSTNRGISWSGQSDIVIGSGGIDKEMITTVDEMQSSPFANNFYCAWTDFNNGSVVKVNRSTDNGITFSSPVTLSSNFGHGTNAQTGPNGEVYVTWADYPSGLPATRMGFAKSLDGGVTYSASNPFTYSGIRVTNGANSNFGGTRVNDFPAMAVDKSCGTHRGRIYITYPEFQANSTSKSLIKIRYSDDQGATWSNPNTINIPTGNQNWLPWISVDDLSGLVTVIYLCFDQSNGSSTNVYVAYSIDGTNWQNIKVSDVAHTKSAIAGFAGGYSGDYIGIASYGGVAYCAWMDDRNGTWQVYVSKVNFDVPTLMSSQTNLEINSPSLILGTQNFQAYQKIKVSDKNPVAISNSAKVNMIAGESITFHNIGFTANYGSEFSAKIQQLNPCTTPGAVAYKSLPVWSATNTIHKEEADGVKLFAYPNPSIDFITIGAIKNNNTKFEVSIFDISGKLIETYKNPTILPDQFRQIVNIESYPKGIYIARIIIDKKAYSINFNKQ